jgi:hypothetical protein
MQTAGMVAALALALASGAAEAQESATDSHGSSVPVAVPVGLPDAVVLRQGPPGEGRLLGKVVDVAPGDHVTVRLPTGERRVVPWPAVERILIAKPPPPPVFLGPKVRVHVVARRKVELQRRPEDSDEWHDACASPCDIELPLADSYRILGMGESKEFRLRGKPGDVIDLDVKLPSTGGKITGGALAGLGSLVLTVSSLFVLIGATAPSSCQGVGDVGPCGAQATSMLDSSLVAAGIGAAAVALGLIVLHYSAVTDVAQNGQEVLPLPDSPDRHPEFSEPRLRISSDPASPTNVPGLVIPFLSGSF